MRNNHWRHTALCAVIVTSIVLSGCDMGGYNPIARSLDPFEPLGPNAKAWFLGTDNSAVDGESTAKVLMLEEGDPTINDLGSFIFIEIVDRAGAYMHTNVTLIRGTYEQIAAGTIELRPYVEYGGTYRQTSNPSSFPDPIDREGQVITTTCSGTDSLNFGTETFRALDTVIALNNADAENMLMIYQIGIFASQVIIPGFGGTGMMTYTTKTPFNGLIAGTVDIHMPKLLPQAQVDFAYHGMANLPGVYMTGILRTLSGATGNGSMSKTVECVDDEDEATANPLIAVTYDAIRITGTIPTSGDYGIDLSGSPVADVSHSVLTPGSLNFGAINQ